MEEGWRDVATSLGKSKTTYKNFEKAAFQTKIDLSSNTKIVTNTLAQQNRMLHQGLLDAVAKTENTLKSL